MGQGDLGSQHQAVVRPMCSRRIFHKSRSTKTRMPARVDEVTEDVIGTTLQTAAY
jgi:hypothetical protein